MSVLVLEAPTLGEGWLTTSRAILELGALAAYDGQATRELPRLALAVEHPSSDDQLIAGLRDLTGSPGCTRDCFVRRRSRAR